MSILVTGGAGFMGSHLAKKLLEDYDDIIIADDLSGGFEHNMPEEAQFYAVDLTNAKAVDHIFKTHTIHWVFHLAAYAAEGLSPFIRNYNYRNNVLASINLINAAVNHNVHKFVFTSSIAVYGDQNPPFTEKMVPDPIDPYGIAKYAVELDLRAAHKMFGLDYTIFRPHNVYGENQNLWDTYRNVIGIFMYQILSKEPLTVFGDGEQTRAFSYHTSVIDAIASCIHMDETKGEIYNVGSDHPVSINALIEVLRMITGVDPDIDYLPERKEAKHAYCDHSKYKIVFGEKDTLSLNRGVRVMWDYACKNYFLGKRQKFENIEIRKGLYEGWTA